MDKFTVVQLKHYLKTKGKKVTGSKAELVERVKSYALENRLEMNDVYNEIGNSQDADDQVSANDSVSQVSENRSTTSSVGSMKAAAIAKRAALQVRMEKLKESERLEEQMLEHEKQKLEHDKQKLRLDQQKERLKLQTELEVANAEAEVLENFEKGEVTTVLGADLREKFHDIRDSFKEDKYDKLNTDSKNVKLENKKEVKVENDVIVEDKDVLKSLIACNVKGLMPQQELVKFDGNYLSYFEFIRSFDSLIASKLVSDNDKIQYLRQYTLGKPQEIVRACLHLDPSDGYARARETLEKRYGNIQRIISAHIEKILSWSDISRDDIENLDKYSIELRSGLNAMLGVKGGVKMLENPKNMQIVVGKLPFNIQERWRRVVDNIGLRKDLVRFEELVEFIESEVRIAMDPIFGRQAFDKNKKFNGSKDNSSRNVSVRSTTMKGSLSCWNCKKDHIIDECSELKRKSREEVLKILRELKLCFACLRHGHRATVCKYRKTCRDCSGNHPTILHKNESEDSSPVNVTKTSTASQIGVFTSKMQNTIGETTAIPVKIIRNGKIVQTKAYLDNGSTVSFCTKGLLRRLGTSENEFCELTLDIRTMIGRQNMKCRNVHGLTVTDIYENNEIQLPPIYAVDRLPIEKAYSIDRALLSRWGHLEHLPIDDSEAEVELMLGTNVPQASEPWEVINSRKEGEPYGARTKLGWVIVGNLNSGSSNLVNRIFVNHVNLMDEEMITSYNRDFQDLAGGRKEFSKEERNWLTFVKENCKKAGEKYEISLPLHENLKPLPQSREIAVRRLNGLRRKMQDNTYLKQYSDFMNDLSQKGYCEEVPSSEFSRNPHFYVPHFGVYHPDKPDKLRVVFDCAAKINGMSLNDVLRPGPDINNLLLGVLLRFRTGLLAFSADIETMFYQVKVPIQNRDLLRYVWWKDNKPGNTIIDMRMTSHPFGACSSPGIANFALRQVVSDYGNQYSDEACKFLIDSFYVDDCLISTDNLDSLIRNSKEITDLCSKGGFNLTKFCSPSIEFLSRINRDKLNKNMPDYIEGKDVFIKALGLVWNLSTDTLGVSVRNLSMPGTKRQLLATIASFYDPLGLLSPFVLEGRIILQNLCRKHVGWDTLLDIEVQNKISNWFSKIYFYDKTFIDRCFKPCDIGNVMSVQWHIFSDASETGYGSVIYLRLVDSDEKIYCSFVMGKARVAPLKAVSIPRLELVAAVLSVKLKNVLCNELDMDFSKIYFWTDSTTVLRYLRSENIRYQTFVANRVSFICENSDVSQWHYVNSSMNPADDSSRARQSERWCEGPEFLHSNCVEWPVEPVIALNNFEDLEVKKVRFTEISSSKIDFGKFPFIGFIEYFSSWSRLCRSAAWMILYVAFLVNKTVCSKTITVDLLLRAEIKIISFVQNIYFSREMKLVSNGKMLQKDPLLKLNPILVNNVLRVGGRLGRFDFDFDEKHPMILPNRSHVTDLIIRHYHVKVGHMGLQMVLSSLRTKFWIVRGSVAVRRVLSTCVECRRYRGNVIQQQMADLPLDRAAESRPPFFVTGLDAFGPFYVKRARSQVKRYGVVFTCLTIRAIHLEVVMDLSTDAFINALRRFLSRRGQVKKIRCDRGTNFVGASKILSNNTIVDEQVLSTELLSRGIEFEFNPPGASHFGGTWERMIASVRRILDVVIGLQVLNDDSLCTLFCEVESIVNSRPLSVVSSDPKDILPITPNRLLNLSDSPLPLQSSSSSYSKNRWKQVQYLADQFWLRWKREYFLCLQQRRKWLRKDRNVSIGDIVLMVDECKTRGHWSMARVVEVKQSLDGLVRTVTVKKGSKLYQRPISKLIMLLEDN